MYVCANCFSSPALNSVDMANTAALFICLFFHSFFWGGGGGGGGGVRGGRLSYSNHHPNSDTVLHLTYIRLSGF